MKLVVGINHYKAQGFLFGDSVQVLMIGDSVQVLIIRYSSVLRVVS